MEDDLHTLEPTFPPLGTKDVEHLCNMYLSDDLRHNPRQGHGSPQEHSHSHYRYPARQQSRRHSQRLPPQASALPPESCCSYMTQPSSSWETSAPTVPSLSPFPSMRRQPGSSASPSRGARHTNTDSITDKRREDTEEETNEKEEEEVGEGQGQRMSEVQQLLRSFAPLLERINTTRRRDRGPKSWEFMIRLLCDPLSNPSLIRWEDESAYTFRLVQPGVIALLWSSRRFPRPDFTYNSFARSLRHHYTTGALKAVSEKQLVYQCGPQAIEYLSVWRQQQQQQH